MTEEEELWNSILDVDISFEEELEHDNSSPWTWGKIRTEAFKEARKRRVARLRELVSSGKYHVPAEKVAWHFLFGRPQWGEALIDEAGNRRDEETTCSPTHN